MAKAIHFPTLHSEIHLEFLNRMSKSRQCGFQLFLFQSLKPTMSIIAIIDITIWMEQYCSTNYTLINKTLPQMNRLLSWIRGTLCHSYLYLFICYQVPPYRIGPTLCRTNNYTLCCLISEKTYTRWRCYQYFTKVIMEDW